MNKGSVLEFKEKLNLKNLKDKSSHKLNMIIIPGKGKIFSAKKHMIQANG